MTAVFSGRFDPVHIGHLATVLRLCKRFAKVVIVVLDYHERQIVDAKEAKHIFDMMLDLIFGEVARNKVDVVICPIHFGKITYEQYELFLLNIGADYNSTVYLTGNPEVLANFDRQQIRCEYVDRTRDDIYTGTAIRSEIERLART